MNRYIQKIVLLVSIMFILILTFYYTQYLKESLVNQEYTAIDQSEKPAFEKGFNNEEIFYFVSQDSDTGVVLIDNASYNIPEYHDLECDSDDNGEIFHQASAWISVNRSFPIITGMKKSAIQEIINKKLKIAAGLFESPANGPTTIKVSYKIAYRFNEFLGVSFYHNHFGCGANHDVGWFVHLNINLITGDTYDFKDLFKKGYNEKVDPFIKEYFVNLLGDISNIGRPCDRTFEQMDHIDISLATMGAKLRQYDPDRDEWSEPNEIKIPICLYAKSDQVFWFDKENLYVLFNMYEIGSAALDKNIVTIPLSELIDVIHPDGPLSFSLASD